MSDGGGTGGGRPPVSDSLTIVEQEKHTLETTIKVLADSLRKAGFETTWTESKTLDNGSRLNISASKRTRYQVSFDGCRMTLHGDSPLEFRSGSDQLMTPEPRDVAVDIGSMMGGRPSSTGNPVSGEHPNQQGDTDLWTVWLSGVANAKLSLRHTMTFGGDPRPLMTPSPLLLPSKPPLSGLRNRLKRHRISVGG